MEEQYGNKNGEKIPKVGDPVFIPSHLRCDNFLGGPAKIRTVEQLGDNVWVTVEECPACHYNWISLSQNKKN